MWKQQSFTVHWIAILFFLLSFPNQVALALQVQPSKRSVPTATSRRQALEKFTCFVIASCSAFSAGRQAKAANLPHSYASPINVPGSIESLVPVVRLANDLQILQQRLTVGKADGSWRGLSLSKTNVPLEEENFKSIFDSYSVPVSYKQRFLDANAFLVYYTKGFDGPGRPNLEADLNLLQTQQYGYRNEAWVAWEDFLYDYRYTESHPEDAALTDLEHSLESVLTNVQNYLALVPPPDLAVAKQIAKAE